MSENRAAPFRSFGDFYPYYLGEHRNRTCRRLHFFGTALAVLVLAASAWSGSWLLLAAAPIAVYGPAWVGHFFFERNRPATFTYPLWSFAGDLLMFWQILTRRLSF